MTDKSISRRLFLGCAAGLAVSPLLKSAPGENGPLLDLHQHANYRGRSDDQLLAHQSEYAVDTTVLLPAAGWMLEQVGDNDSAAEIVQQHPRKYVRFACADPAESRAVDLLRGNIERGAIGIGEMKFHVAVDSPEMHQVYRLAREMEVPVLIHFQYEVYNTGIHRFSKVLEAYPDVDFIGHAQTWWGNISADLDPRIMYPKGPVKQGGLTDRLLSDYPNMYGDLSAGSGLNAISRDPEFSRGFLERHNRKLIWGSDCNCLDGRGAGREDGKCIGGQSLKILRDLAPDQEAFRRITYGNGARVLKTDQGASA